jgi:hypothetical protein
MTKNLSTEEAVCQGVSFRLTWKNPFYDLNNHISTKGGPNEALPYPARGGKTRSRRSGALLNGKRGTVE